MINLNQDTHISQTPLQSNRSSFHLSSISRDNNKPVLTKLVTNKTSEDSQHDHNINNPSFSPTISHNFNRMPPNNESHFSNRYSFPNISSKNSRSTANSPFHCERSNDEKPIFPKSFRPTDHVKIYDSR